MRTMKKLTSMALATLLVIAMMVPAFAAYTAQAGGGDPLYDVLEITNGTELTTFDGTNAGKLSVDLGDKTINDATLEAYQILKITFDTSGTPTCDFASTSIKDALGYTDVNALIGAYQDARTAGTTSAFLKTLIDKLNGLTLTATQTVSTGTDGVYTFDALPFGMYFVKQTKVGSGTYIASAPLLATLPHYDETASKWYTDLAVKAKNDVPTMTKQIENKEDNNATKQSWGDETDQSIGSTVNYKVVVDVPSYNLANVADKNIKLIYFGIKDLMVDGLTFDPTSIKVYGVKKANENTIADDTKTAWTDLTEKYNTSTTADTDYSFTSFVEDYHDMIDTDLQPLYTKVVFYYSAKINKDAVVGTPGNLNTATFVYQNTVDLPQDEWDEFPNNPDKPGTPGTPGTPDTPNPDNPDEPNQPGTPGTPPTTPQEDTAKVYTFGIDLTKTDDTAAKTKLEGAEFELSSTEEKTANTTFWFVKDGDNYTVISLGDPAGLAGDDTNGYTATVDGVAGVAVVKKIISSASSVKIDGLDAYDAANGTGTNYFLTETKAPAGYNLLSSAAKFTLTPLYTDGKSATDFGTTNALNGNVDDADRSDAYLAVAIENSKGIQLPSTGGVGTILFTVIGLALILGCVAVVVTKKSKEKYQR